MKPMYALLALVLATLIPGVSTSAPRTFEILGAGASSCGTWTQDRHDNQWGEDLEWVLGFMSAYNDYASADHQMTKGTDSAGVAAWMDNYCQAHPLDTIADGTPPLIHVLEKRSARSKP